MIITCPSCERDLQTPRGSLGRTVRCPLCAEAFLAELPVAVATEDDTPTLPLGDPFTPTQPTFRVMAAPPGQELILGSDPKITQPVQEAPLPQAQPAPTAPPPEAQSLRATFPAGPDGAPEGWFVQARNGEVGPMHIVQVAKAIGMGKIGPETLLRHSGRNITIFACCCVPGLFAKEAAEAAKATNSPRPQTPKESAEPDPCDFLAQMAGGDRTKPEPPEKPAQTPAENPAKEPAAESPEKPAETGNSNLDELIQAHHAKAEDD